MNSSTIKVADSMRDTEIRNDLPRGLPEDISAEIGDSITLIVTGSDHIKVTLLKVIDPATVNSRADDLIRMVIPRSSIPVPERYVALKLKMRNIENKPLPAITAE